MAKTRSKRYQKRSEVVDRSKVYLLEEAVKAVKKIENAKLDETVALDFQLGIKSDTGTENVRGAVKLPHGSGKKIRVICFCKGEGVREAEKAGADGVGAEDLVQKVLGGWMEFDAVVAHPEMMKEVSKLGRVLGPKGLMPSPKTGTVTPAVGKAVEEMKAGRVEFKSDKTGGLHTICGKLSFSEQALIENARAILQAVQDAKPPVSKGEFIKSVTLAPTHGPGFRLSVNRA